MKRERQLRLIGTGVLAAAMAFASGASAAPLTVLHNGKVFTADPDQPWADAVAIRGDHIESVGSEASVMKLAKHAAQVIDLGGRTVVPGLDDAHVHVLSSPGMSINSPAFIPGPGPTLLEVLDMVQAAAAITPPGTWITVLIGTATIDDAQANRFALDAVAPDHPVRLEAWTGHGMWLNTAAMQVLGIGEEEPDPFGGRWERVPGTQTLTGVGHEYAEYGIRRKLLATMSKAELVGIYQAHAAAALQLGFTSLQDMAVGLPHERALAVLDAADLKLRVRSICVPLSLGEDCDAGPHKGSKRVTRSGIKWITDGTPIERLAFVETAYQDRPGWFGAFNFATDPLEDMLSVGLDGSRRDDQLLFHAVGDGAIDQVLDGMETLGGHDAWADRRTRIEHADLLFPDNVDRVLDLGVVIVQNGTHLGIPDVFAARYTPAVFSEIQPLRSLVEAGVPLALGTDGVGRPLSPWVDIFLTVIHPARPDEALTVEQAVTAYTRGSAYAEMEEHRKGTLAPGMLADLAVLSQDPFTVPPPAIPATYSELTIVGGEIVWSTGAVAPPTP